MVTIPSGELRQKLEQEIVTGAIPPGSKLDEASLAARFDVSRTPIREALHQLSMMGLVEIKPRRGAFVRKVGLKELVEMFEVMAELEGMCGRLAAERMTDEERSELISLHESSKMHVDAQDFDGYYQANVAFHEAIYRGSHNEYLSGQTKSLRNRLAPYRRLQLRRANRLGNSYKEHGFIANAIKNHDGKVACKLLGAHVTVQQGSFNDFIASLPMDIIDQSA